MKNNLLAITLLTCTVGHANLEDVFTQTYQDAIAGKWGYVESVSGPGSTLEQTKEVRTFIQTILRDFSIKSIVDLPCGDFNWMRCVDIINCLYTGIDIVKPLIKKNNELYQSSHIIFLAKDALSETLPCADLIICRDFLVHLSDEDVLKALKNFKASGAQYLLTTTFPRRGNYNIESNGWRPINLEGYPFNFPKPLTIAAEGCTEQNGAYADKSLALWKLEDITL